MQSKAFDALIWSQTNTLGSGRGEPMKQHLLAANRDFRLAFSASTISNLGDGIAVIALPWLATLLTRDAFLISAVAMAGRLPWFLFALPAGVWTDRMDRRQLMVRADLARSALTLCVVGFVLSMPTFPVPGEQGIIPVACLALVAFLIGSAEVIRDNAAQTMLPSIVRPEDLETANGQMWSAEMLVGKFVGPPLAGALIATGIALPFGVNAGTFTLSAGLIWLIALPPRMASGSPSFLPALLEGLGWMRRNRTLLRLALMLGVINAVSVGGLTILVLYAQEVLGLTAAGYGFLLTCGATGGILGGIFVPCLARRIGMRFSLLLALIALGVANVLLGLFGSPILAGIALFVEAVGGML